MTERRCRITVCAAETPTRDLIKRRLVKADDSFAANNQTLSEAGDELSAGLETDRFRLPGTVFRFAADTNLSRVALRYRAPIRVNIKRIAAGVPLLAPARVHSTDCRDCVGCAAVDLSAAAKRFL